MQLKSSIYCSNSSNETCSLNRVVFWFREGRQIEQIEMMKVWLNEELWTRLKLNDMRKCLKDRRLQQFGLVGQIEESAGTNSWHYLISEANRGRIFHLSPT